MKTIIILLLSITVAYSFEQDSIRKGLIANGVPYDPKEFPYVVTIKIYNAKKSSSYGCTGSLVKKDLVMTAAHCVFKKSKELMVVYPGPEDKPEDKPSFHTVKKLYCHEGYDPEKNNDTINDVGLIRLNKPFPQIKKFIKIGGHPDEFADGKTVSCTNIGFGRINNKNDVSSYGTVGWRMDTQVKHGEDACIAKLVHWKELLCSASSTTMVCEGDSGGPMICNGKLYGVCSFSFNFKDFIDKKKNGCGLPDMQTAHSFLHYHLKWINNIIDGKYDKKKKKKKKKKNSANSLKPHLTMYTILAILFCIVY